MARKTAKPKDAQKQNLKSAAPPSDTKSAPIIVLDPALCDAAKQLTTAWSAVDAEELGESGIRNVDVKCTDLDAAKAFIGSLQSRVDILRRRTAVIHPLPNAEKQKTQNVEVCWEYFLPIDLYTIASDIEGTTLHQLKAEERRWRLVEAYLKAFDGPVIRSFVHAPEHVDPLRAEANRVALLKTQKLLITFLRFLNQAAATETHTSDDKRNQPRAAAGLTTPFQLDWVRDSLVSSQGFQLKVPARYSGVLRAWFTADAVNKKAFRTSLSYQDVAELYERARIEEVQPNATREAVAVRLENRGLSDKPEKIAHAFARDFRRWLKNNAVHPDAVFKCDRQLSEYKLGNGWHGAKPVINQSEAGLRRSTQDEDED
jgi:hypothetical protein